jgi:hypothetical protein
MPDLREVFEMTTKQMGEPGLDAWQEQERRQRRASRNRKFGGLAVAAAIVVIVVAVIVGTRGGQQDTSTPASPQTTVEPADPAAEGIAERFFEAYSASDADRAISYLTDDAVLSGWGLEGIREFRLQMRFWEATGFEHILKSCEQTSTSGLGTAVRCAYDFHGLRSDEIGRGPYSGAYDEITVLDGEVVHVFGHFEIAKFSPQMWEPFAEWVSANYPEDVAAMYKIHLSDHQLTGESIRLWEQHTREYVNAVKQGTA